GLSRAAIQLRKILGPAGSYLGIDIISELIDWGAANITPLYPNFRFRHTDIREQWFNPNGTMGLAEYRIPVNNAAIDLVILFSVFTHLLPSDASFYLNEFRRVLRPAGRVYATVFLLDDETLTDLHKRGGLLSFQHRFDEGCYLDDDAHPTRA